MGNAGFMSSTLNPKPCRSRKGALKGALTDPCKGTPGYISPTVRPKVRGLRLILVLTYRNLPLLSARNQGLEAAVNGLGLGCGGLGV